MRVSRVINVHLVNLTMKYITVQPLADSVRYICVEAMMMGNFMQ